MGGLFFDEWSELIAQDVKTVPAHAKVFLPLLTSPLKALDFSGVLSEFGWGRSNVDGVDQMWMGLVKCGWGWIFF